MSRSRYLVPALLCGLLSSLVLLSCDNGSGLLARVQEEKKAQTSGPFTRASVGDLVSFQNAVWARRGPTILKSPDWAEVTTGLPADYACSSLAATGSVLYAAIQSPTAPGLYGSVDGTNWSLEKASSYIESVFTASGSVFYVEHHQGLSGTSTDDTWDLFLWDGTSAAAVVTNNLSTTAESGSPVIGVVIAPSSPDFVVVRGSGVYRSTPAGGPFTLIAASLPTNLSSLAATATELYLGSASGLVYAWNGGAWPASGQTLFAGAPVKALAVVPASATSSLLVAGIGGTAVGATGYYELSLALPDAPGSALLGSANGTLLAGGSATNYETTLRDLPMNAFLYVPDTTDATKGILYAGSTASGNSTASGLHTDAWDGSAWGSWSAK